ncbi:bifunctional indole-3-glycerol-phosphate synthase TrpC/phosphoribosylanthranilate isomerase TrpF [Alteromonas lipotrueiana]|uniref:bifunctional indole-3-glycerol-phosphate synthase TrpC/phosphoribosylanthranilate isomerase TrpF n=1 Tax=Alteromonas lipotrueiana TaxID=2803815 RepID=UPI001C46C710|nr:bifunctional indole-3-glycerol-phosphate synthase TrpC/phosphoribosylanthranilate isomerase TrpF [Alteromonas lipotrueiana]
MANVLEKIVADKQDELAQRKQTLALETLKQAATWSEKSLFEALNKPQAGFILECKKASPSKGLIREHFDLDEILSAYTPYAAALSVLTDEKYFQGNFEYLSYVTARVAQPVLNKDFFIDEYQVYLARYYHADAILLMLSVLDDVQYQALAKVARSLQLDILTEVSNEDEMKRAIALEANIIGINNRNLRDLSTDLATTERLVPMLENAEHEFVVISESGIYTHDDVLRLSSHCDGFLVGSALMAQTDLAAAVTGLILGNIKVCGMSDPEATRHAFNLGASYCGLIFVSKSPRSVTLEQAQHIVQQTPGRYVGVFVDAPIEQVSQYAHQLGLRAVQLHGHEDPAYRETLKSQLPEGCQLWQALGVSGELPDNFQAITEEPATDKVLLDCKVGAQSGGTGKQFDWSLLENITDKSQIALAGGITIDTLTAAQRTGASLVDVNSGVEDAPGQKSSDKLTALFARARHY